MRGLSSLQICGKAPKKMATPYVPVPMPLGSSAASFATSRNQRSSSLGSISSSNSSKGQLEDSHTGTLRQTSAPGQGDSASSVCSSPLLRTKFTNADSCIEYSTRPRESEEQNPETADLEDRPSTPTILGYEVMEERAKFTVSIDLCCTPDWFALFYTCVKSIDVSMYLSFLKDEIQVFCTL